MSEISSESPSVISLRAEAVRRSFMLGKRRIEVLRSVDLTVHRGESLFLTGKSGAGKSTLLYTLAGLERPEGGRVVIEGNDVYAGREKDQAKFRNARIGFVFQCYFLLPELTAVENVMLPGMIGGHPDEALAAAALERVGLSDRMQHLPAELSGGEQQRVALARAVVNDPTILFADEPTGNLDSRTGGEIVEMLLRLVRERNATLIVVTHDQALANRGDRRLEIRDGVLCS